MSGFLAERIWGEEPWEIRLCHCTQCGFTFFDHRLEMDEVKRLYDGYRGSDYQKMRQRHEPGYTEEFNASIGSSTEVKVRKELLKVILSSECDLGDIRSVLDYGGDRGQFIIDELSGAKRYVYEISGVATEHGIESISTIEDCQIRKYDLIMCCHVLEHVSDPLKEMMTMVEMVDDDALFYLELPYDGPFPDIHCPLKVRIFNLLSTFPPLIDMIIENRIFFKMHEHINFFNAASIRKLMELADMDVIRLDVSPVEIGPTKTKLIRCLARKRARS